MTLEGLSTVALVLWWTLNCFNTQECVSKILALLYHSPLVQLQQSMHNFY